MAASGALQDRFFSNDPMINCDLSFLTSLGAWNPRLDLELQLLASVTFKHHMTVKAWSVYDGYIVKKITSGPIVTFDMSLFVSVHDSIRLNLNMHNVILGISDHKNLIL